MEPQSPTFIVASSLTVMFSVNLDDETLLQANEVDDIGANWGLASKLITGDSPPPEVTPQTVLRRSHIAPQVPGPFSSPNYSRGAHVYTYSFKSGGGEVHRGCSAGMGRSKVGGDARKARTSTGCWCRLPHPPSGYFPQRGKRDTVPSARFYAKGDGAKRTAKGRRGRDAGSYVSFSLF